MMKGCQRTNQLMMALSINGRSFTWNHGHTSLAPPLQLLDPAAAAAAFNGIARNSLEQIPASGRPPRIRHDQVHASALLVNIAERESAQAHASSPFHWPDDHEHCGAPSKRSLGSSQLSDILFCRRATLLGLVALTWQAFKTGNASAVQQNLLAGRVPGLSPPDEKGLRTYRRPDAKSGGHGVGWSPIIPYSFKIPEKWEEVPVSIADLGGTEIDLRFLSQTEGSLTVVVAPLLRFSEDFGDDAKIENIGTPEKLINAFGPEVIGQNVEDKVKDMEVLEHNGRTYYEYEIDGPHAFITATAAGNRLYLLTVSANGRQWKKYAEDLKHIADSFRVG